MKIIALEGLDKSGKHTQTKLLETYLLSLGYKVVVSEFHRYDTPTGKLIRDYLDGNYRVSKETIELIMSADKHAQQDWFSQLESDGVDFLILDRYVGTQVCFARAKGFDERFIYELRKNLRHPDFEILLDISPETSMSRKGKHGENDIYERDYGLLSRTRKEYLDYFSLSDDRVVLSDIDNLSVQEVHFIVIHSVPHNGFLKQEV